VPFKGEISIIGEETLETYIVRIYRREPSAPCELAGTVEEPGCHESKHFSDIDQLSSIFRKGSFTGKKMKQKNTPERLKERSERE
jgi:hypothetical protein